MATRIIRLAMRQRSAVTVVVTGVLLANLLVLGYINPPDVLNDDLPMAASCQGGGPGCAEQPLIPPVSLGLPRMDGPVTPVFGVLVRIDAPAPRAHYETPPLSIERPPALNDA